MLQVLQASTRYVCWRCASKRVASDVAVSRLNGGKSLPRASRTLWRRTLATVQHPSFGDNKPHAQLRASEEEERREKLPIRKRLRLWEEEHQDESQIILSDYAYEGDLSNSFTRPQNISMALFEVAAPLFDGDELGDLRSDDAQTKPGDMVELSSEGSRRPMLAVCLGHINGYEHFYTSSGKWFTGLGVKTLFIIHNFVSPAELEPVIKELPSGATPLDTLNTLQDLGHGPSRSTGAALLRKMLHFTQAAEAVYQANAGTLDASSAFIGDPVKHRYLTLHEIAELLLPQSYQKGGKFEPEALYAVHRALLQDEVFFRPLRQTGHKRSYLFEISPLSEVRIIQRAERLVREYLERDRRLVDDKQTESSPMRSFVEKARKLIDHSRQSRQWTKSGIVGPSKKSTPTPTAHEWSAVDMELLQFVELWASYQKFPSYSRLQCFGSAILQAIDRYRHVESFTASTGWMFLQEVGWIPSWEIPARYSIRFPGVEIERGGGYVRPFYGNLDRHLKSDIMAPMRKVWEDLTAYCIDSESTTEIDDAVSVESTSDPDQHWIQVHVADPGSAISAETPVAKYAELIPQTIYLPGHSERMLPDSLGQNSFSLAPNRPEGAILDYKILPGILKDVVYMTSEDVASALEERREDPIVGEAVVNVGPTPKPKPAERQMTRPGDLNNDQMGELSLLSELGKAIQARRLSRGATPIFQPRAEAQAYFDHIPRGERSNFLSVKGDPAIRIAYSQRSGTDLVENTMKLAGEIAAKWCHERGIPIPFRSQPHAMRNAAALQQYTKDVFYPLLKAGIRPDDNHWRQLRSLIGNDEITTTAGPHFTLGVSMYTKATSPLRRFSDLVVHWQIEAALLEEHRRGQSLVGSKDGDYSFLPFSREELDRMLPMIRVREKQARELASGDGGDQWILQALVRAWRFGEAKIPETFRFHVVHVHSRRSILGRLDWFERSAQLRPDALNDMIRMVDARIGDVYEVKLKNVNVHGNQILVEVVKVLEKADGEPPISPNASSGGEAQAMHI
ncbi:RNB-domain-containing protein [Hypoxylon sp. NC1633]|nr:RNB-domain-containing protein [Hypoxylon sp. NC1633]